MTGHLAVAIVLVGGVAWILPGLLMQRVGVSATVAGGIGAALLFLASASTLWVMDLYGEPLRFADPAQEGAFVFSAATLCVLVCPLLAVRIAKLKGARK